jgi:hypothetical protein
MGNHLCCVKPSRTTAAAKVIRWDDGSIEDFREAIKVGELMLDNPQQFLCDFSNLQAGRRIEALRADDYLAFGGLYVLLPMQKYLRRVLSPSDMASINLLAFHCNYGQRKFSCDSRIIPSVGAGNVCEFSSRNGSSDRSDKSQADVADRFVLPKLDLDEDEDQTLGLGEQRIRRFSYWKPALETIKESPRISNPKTSEDLHTELRGSAFNSYRRITQFSRQFDIPL